MSEVQRLLDEIAVETGSGASLDDLSGQLVAYSTHRGRADDARVRALLERRSPEDVRAWETQHGVASATRPLVVPGNPGLGMSPRICVPLVHRGIRIGMLFLIAEDGTPTDADAGQAADLIAAHTTTLAALLYESTSPSLEVHRAREVDLLAACRGDAAAADRLAETIGQAASGRPVAVVVSLVRGGVAATQARVAAHQVLSTGAPVLAHAVTKTHVVAIVRAARPQRAVDAASDLRTRLLGALPGPSNDSLPTGTCAVRDLTAELGVAYSRALTAAQATAVDPALAEVVDWEDVGLYRLIGQLGEDLPTSVLVERVAQAPNGVLLLSTLESVYDHAGGVRAVAAELNLHRTSLYHRLTKVRELLGSDPLDGQTRTELHLALKLRRWDERPLV